MKRLITLLSMLVACVTSIFAQNDVMYVYRNDGVINAFMKADIDSIRHSNLDLDGMPHSVNVVQEVWTADSTYRIPLALIDSVGFVTPGTLYQEGAYPISTDMLDYIVGSDSLTLYFSSSTPSHLLPSVGDKLVFDRVTETLPHGFLGEVGELSTEPARIVVRCNALGFNDVYARYYSFSTMAEEARNTRSSSGSTVFSWRPATVTLDPITVDVSSPVTSALYPDPLGNFSMQMDECRVSTEIRPSYTVSAYLIVSDELGVNFHVSYKEDYTCSSAISLSGKITHQGEHGKSVDLKMPLIPFLQFYGEVGLFNRTSMSGSIKHEHVLNWSYKTDIDFSDQRFFLPEVRFSQIKTTFDDQTEVMINGQFNLGVFAELGLKIDDKRLASIALRGEAGIRLGGNAVLYAKDSERASHSTEVYNSLRDTELYLNRFRNVGARAKIFIMEWSGDVPSLSQEENVFKVCPVPQFANTAIERYEDAPEELFVQAQVSGTTLPVDLGFTLFEGTSREGVAEEGTTYYCATDYHGPSAMMAATLFDVDDSKGYTVYPTVKLWGSEMIAEPSAEVENDLLREQLIRFYQSTGGDNWYHNDNWCTDAPIEEWYGIGVAPNGFLSIVLEDNNLCGDADLSDCKELGQLYCRYNQLTGLNLSGCIELYFLHCKNNHLTSLNVRDCPNLIELYCYNNQIDSLDLSSCLLIEHLGCSSNRLKELDVSMCPAIKSLSCEECQITNINISGCKALESLDISENQLFGTLDVGGFSRLRTLDCYHNQFSVLNVSDCTSLELLYCNENQIESLNVSRCTSLKVLDCGYNQVSGTLEVNGFSALEFLSFVDNQLTNLNVRGCKSLQYLYCSDNYLTGHLDVSELSALLHLCCDYNQLTSIDATGCISLERLVCYRNHINQEITSEFERIDSFYYDRKYNYWDAPDGSRTYTTNEYGWWYPGEPESGHHGR